MKKKAAFLFLAALSIVSLGESRTAYIMVPSDLDLNDVKVTGIVKESSTTEKQFTESGVIDPEVDESVNVSVALADEYQAYDGTKYIKMSVDGIESGDDVKFMLGYPVVGGDVPKYTIISSSDIKDNPQIDSNFEKDLVEGLEMMDFANLTDYDTYDTFPGRELSHDVRLSGFVVGDTVMEETGEPSNIVDIYYKTGDPLTDPNVVSGGAPINPTGSPTNNEFQLWSVRTTVPDENGDFKYLTSEGVETDKREEAERILLYSNKTDDTPIYSDFTEFTGKNKPEEGTFYAGGEEGESLPEYIAKDGNSYPYGYYDNFVFDVVVRFQNKSIEDEDGNKVKPTLKINEVPVGLNEVGFKWEFYDVADIGLTYTGNGFIFGFEGTEIIIVPEDPSTVIPPPIAQKIYVTEDTGEANERSAQIISKYEEVVKKRTTNVKMKVMTSSGSTEKNYEIEDIEE